MRMREIEKILDERGLQAFAQVDEGRLWWVRLVKAGSIVAEARRASMASAFSEAVERVLEGERDGWQLKKED